MARTIVRNMLGNKTHSFRLPCDDTVASAFCASVLDGEYAIYTQSSVSGTDTATPYDMVSLVIQNTLGLKSYLNLAVKTGKSEADIATALIGKTFNGVKVDFISVTKRTSVA